MKLALVFPGQGSQYVGMGADWYEHYPAARAVFEQADARLGESLSSICFEGPEEALKLTANTQPAILSVSYAVYSAVADELGIRAAAPGSAVACLAGHSLGEYTALVVSGALDFGDAVETVRRRGSLMQQAVPVGTGAMAAVLELGAEEIGQINREVASELNLALEIANYNHPGQIVVSGAAEAVRAATPKYSAAGAKRVVELPVSAPFHCSLMVPAADGLRPSLEAWAWRPAATPVLANLTAQPYPGDPAQYPLLLHAQIFNSVRWTETVQYMAAEGVTHILEIGPGKVLRGLLPRILASGEYTAVKGMNLDKLSQLDEVREFLASPAREAGQ
ncbi:ACP S-malonyltransferase [bacterium]|nr:ACP S-malonyltransferase [bacterium]